VLVHARELLTQIDYGPAIAAAIAKVQTLLDADSASICLTETAAVAVQHVITERQEMVSITHTAGSLAYPLLAEDAVFQRRDTCATCRMLPEVAWCASAPLYAEGRQFGILCAARKRERPAFNQEQMHLLQLLALWSAIAISNARRVRTAQELQRSQRERIAAHLHDNTAQSLSIIGLKVDQVAAMLGSALGDDGAEQLRTIKSISQQLMAHVRAAFGELSQAAPQSDDLVTALAGCIEIFTQTARVPVEFSIAGAGALPADAQAQAVQIVREALNNVARHAQAGSVQVKLLGDGETLRIVVQDNGVGFDLRSVGADQRHLGTILMHERAQRSGGSLTINSHPGRGTQVTLTYPTNLQS
jgi:two-component system nitrate/nitrite sensor histidine kinase NarX